MRPGFLLYLFHAIFLLTLTRHAIASPSSLTPSVSSSYHTSLPVSSSQPHDYPNTAISSPHVLSSSSTVQASLVNACYSGLWADLRNTPPDQCYLHDLTSGKADSQSIQTDASDNVDVSSSSLQTTDIPHLNVTETASEAQSSVESDRSDVEDDFVSFEEWKRIKEMEEDNIVAVPTTGPVSGHVIGSSEGGHIENQFGSSSDSLPKSRDGSLQISEETTQLLASSLPSSSPPPIINERNFSSSSSSSSSSSVYSSSSSAKDRDAPLAKESSPRHGVHRYNYASPDCSARIHSSSPSTQHASSLLHKSRDRYMLTPCRAGEHWVVIELCDEIRVEAIEIAVWEFFSGIVKDVRVSVGGEDEDEDESDEEEDEHEEIKGAGVTEGDSGLTSMERKGSGAERTRKKNGWKDVGSFVTKNIRGVQTFVLPEPTSFHRFLRLDFPTFYGNEYYCPVSQLKVYGMNQMEAFKWEQRRQSAAADRGWAREEAARERERREKEKREEVDRRAREDAMAKREKEEEENREKELNELEKLVHEQVARLVSSSSSVSSVDVGKVEENETLENSQQLESGDGQVMGNLAGGVTRCLSGSIESKVTASSSTSGSNTAVTTASPPYTSVISTILDSPNAATSSVSSDGILIAANGTSSSSASVSSSQPSSQSPLSSMSSATTSVSASTTTITTTSTTTVRPPTRSDSSESIYAFIIRRLTALEENGTLVARYAEEQGRTLRALIARYESRWGTRRQEWEESERFRWERERMRYEERFGRVISQLESMRMSLENERRGFESQFRLLADEIGYERRRSFAQLLVLIIVIVLGALTRIDVIDAVLRPIIDDARRRRRSLRRPGKGKSMISSEDNGLSRPLSVGPLAGLRIDVDPKGVERKLDECRTDIDLSDMKSLSDSSAKGNDWIGTPTTTARPRINKGSGREVDPSTPITSNIFTSTATKFRPSPRGSGNGKFNSRPTTPSSYLSPSSGVNAGGSLVHRRRSTNPTPNLGLGHASSSHIGNLHVPRSASMSDYPASAGITSTMPHSPIALAAAGASATGGSGIRPMSPPGSLVIRQGYKPRIALPTPKGSSTHRRLARSAHLHAMEGSGRRRPGSAVTNTGSEVGGNFDGEREKGGAGVGNEEPFFVLSPSKSRADEFGSRKVVSSKRHVSKGLLRGGEDAMMTGRFPSPDMSLGETEHRETINNGGISHSNVEESGIGTLDMFNETKRQWIETESSDADVDEELDNEGDGWRTDDGDSVSAQGIVGSASETEEELVGAWCLGRNKESEREVK